MDPNIPQPLKNAAIAQIVSGVVSWFFMATMSMFTMSCLCGTATFFLGGLGSICGLAGFLLIPIGMVEIGSGVYCLMNPREAAPIMKIVSYVEMGSIIFGGLNAAIVGVVVQKLLADDEVVAFLEG